MKLTTPAFTDGAAIPDAYAFATPAPESHVTLSDNLNPAFRIEDVPDGTRSLALVCHDSDVPTEGTDVNQEGREVPADLPRTDFFHWVLVDLPASVDAIAEGEYSRGVTAGGKDGSATPHGAREGINDYTGWFAGDADMAGDYRGYDGPGPPWNDALLHHYHFTVYALDVERLDLADRFGGAEALAAIEGHVLDSARVTGTYTLNPRLR